MQMDGFLGTSIQYSERQILLLEQQHAAKHEKMVEELIQSGFLDSDYESSVDSNTFSETDEFVKLDDAIHYDDTNAMEMALFKAHDISTVCEQPLVDESEYIAERAFVQLFVQLKDSLSVHCNIKWLTTVILFVVILPHLVQRYKQPVINGDDLAPMASTKRDAPQIRRQTNIFWIYDASAISMESIRTRSRSPNGHKLEAKRLRFPMELKWTATANSRNPCNKFAGYGHGHDNLFLHFGAVVNAQSPEMMKLMKETRTNYHITALIMSFVGIAVFAVSHGNVEELMQ